MTEDCRYEEAMTMLFTAKWNLPMAARLLEVSDEECKEIFKRFCSSNPPTYTAGVPKDSSDSGQTV